MKSAYWKFYVVVAFRVWFRNLAIVTMYFLSDFTQIKAWSHLQHFLATSVHYVLHSKRFQAWPGLMDRSYITLNVRFKNLWTKFWDRLCYSTMYQIFLIQIAFQRSDKVELDFWVFVVKIALNFKSQGTKKSNFPPKGPTTFKFWVMKLLLLPITNMQKFSSLLCWI